jgi:hypothetical protein
VYALVRETMSTERTLGTVVRKLCEKLASDLPAIVLGSLIAAYIVSVPVHVNSNTADSFFGKYYKTMSRVGMRHEIYRTDFTPDFRHFEGWKTYRDFWRAEGYATSGQVFPTPGNPLEFQVFVTFHPPGGIPRRQAIDYYLTCSGFIGTIYSKFFGCLGGDIRIDRLEWVSPGAS